MLAELYNDGHNRINFLFDANKLLVTRYQMMDWDNDGIGDNSDMDDDGDGYNDTEDMFPKNSNEHADNDLDGILDRADDCPEMPEDLDEL